MNVKGDNLVLTELFSEKRPLLVGLLLVFFISLASFLDCSPCQAITVYRNSGYSVTSISAPAIHSGTTFIPIRWWTPFPFSSPLYQLSSHMSLTGGYWTTTISLNLNSIDRFPPSFDRKFNRYVQPESEIQSDHPEIASLAYSLTKDCLWQSDAVEVLERWVSCNIDYDYTFSLPNDALSVLRNRSGVCAGYSSLLTALLRAVGIPSHLSIGMPINPWGGPVSWTPMGGGHAWVSVFYPTAGWVMIDPTNSIGYLDWGMVPNYPLWWYDMGKQGIDIGTRIITQSYRSRIVETTSYPGDRVWQLLPNVTHLAPTSGPLPIAIIERYPGFTSAYVVDENRRPEGFAVFHRKGYFRGGIAGGGGASWMEGLCDSHSIMSGPPSLIWSFNSEDGLLDSCLYNPGTHAISLRVEDVSGRSSTASIEVLVTRPPKARMSAPALSSAQRADNRFKIALSVLNEPKRDWGATRYFPQKKVDSSSWFDLPSTTARYLNLSARGGQTTHLRARCVDSRGITGPYSAMSSVIAPYNDSALRYSTGWSKRSAPNLYLGSARQSSRKGSWCVYRFTKAKQLYLIATKKPNGGYADVYINNVKRKTINLYSANLRPRQSVYSFYYYPAYPSPISGTIKVVVKGARCASSKGSSVEVDGLGVRR